jgi:hypothetical protein
MIVDKICTMTNVVWVRLAPRSSRRVKPLSRINPMCRRVQGLGLANVTVNYRVLETGQIETWTEF